MVNKQLHLVKKYLLKLGFVEVAEENLEKNECDFLFTIDKRYICVLENLNMEFFIIRQIEDITLSYIVEKMKAECIFIVSHIVNTELSDLVKEQKLKSYDK